MDPDVTFLGPTIPPEVKRVLGTLQALDQKEFRQVRFFFFFFCSRRK
jgi:hypothetical protein